MLLGPGEMRLADLKGDSLGWVESTWEEAGSFLLLLLLVAAPATPPADGDVDDGGRELPGLSPASPELADCGSSSGDLLWLDPMGEAGRLARGPGAIGRGALVLQLLLGAPPSSTSSAVPAPSRLGAGPLLFVLPSFPSLEASATGPKCCSHTNQLKGFTFIIRRLSITRT
jgi:hypothetical protein